MEACKSVTPTENPEKMSEPSKKETKEVNTPEHGIEEENRKSDWTDIDHGQIIKDVCNFREHFKLKNFLTNLTFGLVPSAWDIGTDFVFARQLTEDKKCFIIFHLGCLSLLFIALPGLVYLATQVQSGLEKCTKNCNCPKVLKKVFSNVISLVLVGMIICSFWILIAAELVPVCKTLAVITASSILLIKTLAVFIHTEEVNKLAVKTTNYEGSYESSLQLILAIVVWQQGKSDLTLVDMMTMASSLVMIAKSGAENFPTFGAENKLPAEISILAMLRILANFTPVYLLTGFFRVGTLALYISRVPSFAFFLFPLAHTISLIAVLLVKLCSRQLVHLSVTELVQGLVGELTCIVLWGRTGREGSRKIQLWIGGYLLLLYTAFLVIMPFIAHQRDLQMDLYFVVCLLLSGYGLFIYQVFLFGKYNVDWKEKSMKFSLAAH